MLAQTRPGARGALLLHGCVPASEFEAPWPDGVPQIHAMDADEWMELDVAEKLVEEAESGELFLYPAVVICSRIAVSTTTTKKPRTCSRSASSCSWTASDSGPFPQRQHWERPSGFVTTFFCP
jgi:hypothetical protein